ncbi:MAG TPA: hypothetical protein VF887_06885 [Gemmatimonadaceae bacterium]
MTPANPTLVQGTGNIPPPPVDAAIQITVFSTPVSGLFTGVYFANAAVLPSVVAALDASDPDLAFSGTAWLRLDNTQGFGSTASANARFQNTSGNLSGRGTLVIEGETIHIVAVTSFTANPNCHLTLFPCAVITFDATIDSDPGVTHHGTATAFDKEVCTFVYPIEGSPYFTCPNEIG